MSQGCKQSPRSKGGKNKITSNEGSAPIIVVKLLRTDTTLDLSQKARVVRNSENERRGFYSGNQTAHGPSDRLRVFGSLVSQHMALYWLSKNTVARFSLLPVLTLPPKSSRIPHAYVVRHAEKQQSQAAVSTNAPIPIRV